MVRTVVPLTVTLVLAAIAVAQQPGATVEKPKSVATHEGICRLRPDGTLGATFGPTSLPTLAFTIGPGSTMADQMHANKAKYAGAGSYLNVIVAVYLGKTALEDSYMGLGTVTITPDGHSGTFALNDKSASGRFDCGTISK